MLELKQIVKDYPAGDGIVHALKGVSVKFRKSEFVSILGPSGCGKTTMLNIIGGLDQYTSGDLLINGRSTKDFKDRDWDTYRNHSIGFVFQSYNLIPHQTVLQNVELALTLSGVSKSERKKRAKKALEDVGLGNQLNKKPTEMSGGQMQRVAIARALVNDPDIILADEPTGALDTETSVQVMEILKEISKDRLIVMVTHNPELAEKYSTRIIRMLDGEIKDDTVPFTEEENKALEMEVQESKKEVKKQKKPSMSFATAFMLSLKNLFTKKGRTTLTAFAGSIGIIGIALILAISQGMTLYIDTVQEEALSSYPLTIEKTTVDMTELMNIFMNMKSEGNEHENDAVYQKSAIYDMMNSFNNLETQDNDLKSFKEYVENDLKKEDAVNGVQYSYDLPLMIYTKNVDGNIIHSDASDLMMSIISEYMGMDMSSMMSSTENSSSLMGSMMSMSPVNSAMSNLWQEMLSGKDGAPINDVLKNQYDVVYGSWPNDYDEIVLVVDEHNEINDITLYALGLISEEQIDKIMSAAMEGTTLETDMKSWSYEEICDLEYHLVLNSDCYSYDDKTGLYTDLRETDAGIRYLYDNGIKLKVTGIIKPNEDATTTMLTGSIGYTKALTEYVVEQSQKSDAIKAQMENKGTDVITGLPFKDASSDLTDEFKAEEFKNYVSSLSDAEKAQVYIKIKSIPDDAMLKEQVDQYLSQMTREDIENAMGQGLGEQMGVSADEIMAYISNMSDDELMEMFGQVMLEQQKTLYAEQVEAQMSQMTVADLVAGLDAEMAIYTTQQCSAYYDEVLEFSESDYDSNLLSLGYVQLDSPSTINIYASSFENKDLIEDKIAEYNKGKDEVSKIKYTDYIGIMMSSVTTIINAITYVLIAFVAISLIVSSIMIGVITLISVQERTKEIGILRAIGASKKNVSSMFTAETIIIGFCAGLLGVLVTYVLCIPINIIINKLTGIANLNAVLPVSAAIILVLISMALTLISGLIPSKSAAKKDPVVALRTE